jgi:hypothetical protein
MDEAFCEEAARQFLRVSEFQIENKCGPTDSRSNCGTRP